MEITKLLFNDSSIIIYAILGWWFNKQYDRYIEDLIEDSTIEENERFLKFKMYQQNPNIQEYVKTLWNDWENIPDKNSQKAKDKIKEFQSWIAPFKITKKEARDNFNWIKFILCYAIPIIPVIKIFFDKITNGFCLKSYIINVWK